MRIFVKVTPNAPHEVLKQLDTTHFEVSVTKPPIQGQANRALIKVLAEYFSVKPYNIAIIQGKTSRQKIIEIEE